MSRPLNQGIGHRVKRALAALVVTLGLVTQAHAGDAKKGAEVYAAQCAFCHGPTGGGNGPDAEKFYWAPANFKTATFKFRSTRTGTLPTDADLARTIKRGLAGTAMVAMDHLTDAEIADVIAHIKTFSPKWKEGPGEPIKIEKPANFADLAKEGPDAYKMAGCAQCHGGAGRGGGPSSAQLTQNGRPTKPADLSLRPFKSGDTPEDIYRTLATGLDGTPMFSLRDVLDPPQIWKVVAQVVSFQRKTMPKGVPADETLGLALVKEKQPGRKK